jgi:AcrR family transcriptional regulator
MNRMTAARTPTSAPATSPAQPGLRERKKIKTRATIREAAYRLIAEQGYDATTIEQIADAAEVSPSTVSRYFPAKEDILLTDDQAPLARHDLLARPADEPLFETLRAVLGEVMTGGTAEQPEITKLRARLMTESPAIRSRMLESMSLTGRLVREVMAEHSGRDVDGLEVRAYATGLIGALLETTLYWAERGHRDDLCELIDRTLHTFEHGLGG